MRNGEGKEGLTVARLASTLCFWNNDSILCLFVSGDWIYKPWSQCLGLHRGRDLHEETCLLGINCRPQVAAQSLERIPLHTINNKILVIT